LVLEFKGLQVYVNKKTESPNSTLLGVGALVVGGRSSSEGGMVKMLCLIISEHAVAEAAATVLLDLRAHPETAGPVA
jgi:hypothetical protein